MAFVKRLRLRSFWHVFGRDLWFIWVTLTLIAGPALWALFDDRRGMDWAVRIAGFLLVLAALVLVAFRLYSLRRRFDDRWTLSTPITRWFRKAIGLVWEWPTQTIHANTGRAVFTTEPATLSASGASAGTIEERIKALERRASMAEKEIANVRKEARKAVAECEQRLRTEAAGVQQDVARNYRLLKRISLDGLKAEAVGVFWLILGQVLTTFNAEIAACSLWRFFV